MLAYTVLCNLPSTQEKSLSVVGVNWGGIATTHSTLHMSYESHSNAPSVICFRCRLYSSLNSETSGWQNLGTALVEVGCLRGLFFWVLSLAEAASEPLHRHCGHPSRCQRVLMNPVLRSFLLSHSPQFLTPPQPPCPVPTSNCITDLREGHGHSLPLLVPLPGKMSVEERNRGRLS